MSIRVRRWKVLTLTFYSLAAVAGLLYVVFLIAFEAPETLWAYRDIRLPIFLSLLAVLVSLLAAFHYQHRWEVAARNLRQRLGID